MHFSIIAEHYGHEVWNIDLPENNDSKYYGEVIVQYLKYLTEKSFQYYTRKTTTQMH